MKRALVTGATGFVGRRLCRELIENNYQVYALHRKGRAEQLKGLSVCAVEGDLTDLESLRRATRGVDVVFHIAALYREAKFPDSRYWEVNLGGTESLTKASVENGVKRFIHCSTIGVHSTIKNPPADETEPYAPTDVYQETKVAGEKHVLECFKTGTLKGAIIRPAMIWGPSDTRFLKFFRGIKNRRLPIIGNGKNLCHWILVDDLARAFRLAGQSDKSGEVYIIAGSHPVTLEHTMQTIADTYGVKLLPFKIPVLPIQIVGSIVETLCRPFGIEPPLHRRRADFFIKNRAFNCTKANRDLGFNASHTFEEECAFVANWYRDNKWV